MRLWRGLFRKKVFLIPLLIGGVALAGLVVWRGYSERHALRHPDWTIAEAYRGIVEDPQSAAAAFRKAHNPPGYMGLVLVLRLLTPDPAAHKQEVASLLAKIHSSQIPLSPYDGSVGGLVPYLDAAALDSIYSMDPVSVSCELLRKYPVLLDAVADNYFGGGGARYLPGVSCNDPRYLLPASVTSYQREINPLVGFFGCGTMEYSYEADQRSLQAAITFAPNFQPPPGQNTKRINYDRTPLKNWSYLSLWNRHEYLRIRKEFFVALHALTHYYNTVLGLPVKDAKKAAYLALYTSDPAQTPPPDPLVKAILDNDPLSAIQIRLKHEKSLSGFNLAMVSVDDPAALKLLLAAEPTRMRPTPLARRR